jgi:hypothetical protein
MKDHQDPFSVPTSGARIRIVEHNTYNLRTDPNYRHQIDSQIQAQIDEVTAYTALAAKHYWEKGGGKAGATRKRNNHVDTDNPATRLLMDSVAGFSEWLIHKMPRASALHYLRTQGGGDIYRDLVANSQFPPIDSPLRDDPEPLRRWFESLYDGIGINSREVVYDEIFSNFMISAHESHSQRPNKVLSLACGEADSTINGIAMLQESHGIETELTLADADEEPLRAAGNRARRMGVKVKTICRDLTDLKGFRRAHKSSIALKRSTSKKVDNHYRENSPSYLGRLQPEQYDIVDAIGFFEYLSGNKQFPFHYNKVTDDEGRVISQKEVMKAGAPTFLKHAFEMVAPGGVLIIGNMNIVDPRTGKPRPQLDFTMDVVQWPHIQPRAEDDVIKIIEDSGVVYEEIEIHRSLDGIYNLYVIRKLTKPRKVGRLALAGH